MPKIRGGSSRSPRIGSFPFLRVQEDLRRDEDQKLAVLRRDIALLEEPLAVVEALAPFAFSTHLKDMAVQEYEEGYLLSEVPLGEGFLDLKKMVAVLEKANPKVQFNLEMITRDPLSIPCLGEKYWATLDRVPGRDLARALAWVRANPRKQPLPRISRPGRGPRGPRPASW